MLIEAVRLEHAAHGNPRDGDCALCVALRDLDDAPEETDADRVFRKLARSFPIWRDGQRTPANHDWLCGRFLNEVLGTTYKHEWIGVQAQEWTDADAALDAYLAHAQSNGGVKLEKLRRAAAGVFPDGDRNAPSRAWDELRSALDETR
jgi:hypothetical protein